MIEYFCHYCRDWFDSTYSQSHFETVHGQLNMTFDALKKRMDGLGGLVMRELKEGSPTEEEEKPKPKNWLFKDDKDDEKIFVTNNFQHNMR